MNRLEEASAEEVRRLRQHIGVLQAELARISSNGALQQKDEVQVRAEGGESGIGGCKGEHRKQRGGEAQACTAPRVWSARL